MVKNHVAPPSQRPAGYAELIQRYDIEVVPHWRTSYVATSGTRHAISTAGVTEEVYPSKYWPGDALGDHLEFALKHDGVNLAILAGLFKKAPPRLVQDYVKSKPTGKYARRAWFLYEFLTGRRLQLRDLNRGNYIDLLDPDQYYTVTPTQQIRRQRINYNMLGESRFCPIVRRTDALKRFESLDLPKRCQKVMSRYPPELIRRAMSYLYTKETRSSFEIEHIEPTSSRAERFVALLQLAETEDFCDKKRLIALQNRTVDPRFRDSDYRTSQNYVGETIAGRENVHFVSPTPRDLPELMDGLIAAHARMDGGSVPAVIHAAAVAYGFVFLHPFEDGNGRIHRFLIHNILARRGFTPPGIIFPVSAAMLKHMGDYDASLDAFSRPLMPLVDYALDDEGRMTVRNDTAHWYRHIEMTAQAEALFRFVERTIEAELAEELAFLSNYDRTKKAIQEIVDMPDRRIDLFIRACVQNHGRLSARKRAAHFASLTDEEVGRMEQAVQASYGVGSAAR
jgi:hypothetical protein